MLFEFDDALPLQRPVNTCAFCETHLHMWSSDTELEPQERTATDRLAIKTGQCPSCGWWTASNTWTRDWFGGASGRTLRDIRQHQACGVLKQLDVEDIETPLQEVRDYLAARYADRFKIHPRRMEEVVQSVFRDFGFRTLLTPRSGDDGIDVLLYGPGEVTVGVEVKRYKNAITAEQIRAFTGALLLGDHAGGIYVTTSTYERGAMKTAKRAWEKGVMIHLLDADSLLAALRIAQRTVLRSPEQLKELSTRLDTRADLLTIDRLS